MTVTHQDQPPTTPTALAAGDPADGLPAPPPGEHGLTSARAAELLTHHGANRLVPEARRTRLPAWLMQPLRDPMAILLVLAAAVYIAIGDVTDAAITFVALGPVLAIGWVLEARAERTLERLRALTAPVVTVWRDGGYRRVAGEDLVPGDLVAVREGDVVPADAVLVTDATVLLDESALTGESQPVSRAAGTSEAEVLAGTTVLAGRGLARVHTTGAGTQYGSIGSLVAQIREPATPLQRSVSQLLRWFGGAAAVFCVAVVVVQRLQGEGWGTSLIAGVSLAIAAVPEEFAMVYALYLALGAWRLARVEALVRRMTGVETLGSTTVICTDKTGTLTLGQLTVAGVALADGRLLLDGAGDRDASALLEAAVLACEPAPFDPLEQAIVAFAGAHRVDVDALHALPLVHDHPFDAGDKYLTHVWRRDGRFAIVAKGAVEGVLAHSAPDPEAHAAAVSANHRLADQGMRVIAVAAGALDQPTGDRHADEAALHFVGLVAFTDPVRPGVTDALGECRRAGIRVVMITGDHPVTAHAVAEGLDLPHVDRSGDDRIATGDELDTADEARLAALVRDVNVFARTRPEQKHLLVEALRAQGDVVAMTGDGINDAPALREADIGVAMGRRGTEVAREAATMVLLDDNFATIVAAVRNGRRIYDNLVKAFAYLVAFKPPLLLAALVIPLLDKPLLLLPIQLVLSQLILHPVVSLVFENEPPAPDLMDRPPRDAGQGFVRRDLALPLAQGITLAIATIGLYLAALAQDLPTTEARALGFTTLLLGQTMLVAASRSTTQPVWRTHLRANPVLLPMLGGLVAMTLAVVYVPPIADLLKLSPFAPHWWLVVVALAALSTLWAEPFKRPPHGS